MADEKLTALPLASALTGTEVLYGVQVDTSVKISGNQIKSFANVPGGTAAQVQFNDNGAFGGFTVSGDGTLVTSTGALTVSKLGGVPVSSNYVAKTATFILQCTTVGDFYELWMSGSDNTCNIPAVPASTGSPSYPASPSIVIAVWQVG
jgi:hypothetical protein